MKSRNVETHLKASATFPDGELDLWPSIKNSFQRFDSLNDWRYSLQLAGVNKIRFINQLTDYADKIGCSFVITPKDRVNITNGFSNDIFSYSIGNDLINIPRFVIQKRPNEAENKFLFRREIPAAFIIVNLAHEFGHLERNRKYPDLYRRVYNGAKADEPRHSIEFNSAIEEEEMETDKHAFQLLKKLGIPITPQVYIAQTPQSPFLNYQEKLMITFSRDSVQSTLLGEFRNLF